MIKICLGISLCLFFFSTVFAQVASEINIAPIVSANFYDENFIYQNSASYGLALSTSLIGSLSTGISYKTSQTSAAIEVPGNSISMKTRWHLYQFHLRYEVIRILKIIHISPGIGLGVIRFTTPTLMINLGALGNTTIPSRSSSHFAYSASVNLRIHLVDRISLLLVPGILFFENPDNKFTNYYVDGGISIAIK